MHKPREAKLFSPFQLVKDNERPKSAKSHFIYQAFSSPPKLGSYSVNNSGLITIESHIYLGSKLQTKRILNLATKQIKIEEMETYQFDKTTNVERKANETFLPNWSV